MYIVHRTTVAGSNAYVYSTYDMDRSVLKTPPPQSMKGLCSVWCIAHFTIHRYFVRSYLVHPTKKQSSFSWWDWLKTHAHTTANNEYGKNDWLPPNGEWLWILNCVDISEYRVLAFSILSIRLFVRCSPYTYPFSGETKKKKKSKKRTQMRYYLWCYVNTNSVFKENFQGLERYVRTGAWCVWDKIKFFFPTDTHYWSQIKSKQPQNSKYDTNNSVFASATFALNWKFLTKFVNKIPSFCFSFRLIPFFFLLHVLIDRIE